MPRRNDVKLAEVLAQLAVLDADDLPIRKKLAQLALAAGDFAAAARWGREALHIDVMDVDVHRHAGRSGGRQRNHSPRRRTNMKWRCNSTIKMSRRN